MCREECLIGAGTNKELDDGGFEIASMTLVRRLPWRLDKGSCALNE